MVRRPEKADGTAYQENLDADMLMISFSPISSKMMRWNLKLKVIGISRTGTENVNIPAATERGILVVNAAGHSEMQMRFPDYIQSGSCSLESKYCASARSYEERWPHRNLLQ